VTPFNATLVEAATLLNQRAAIDAALRKLGVTRSENMLGDLAEFWAAGALSLALAQGSNKGFDATDGNGVRYQIKARRPTAANPSRQLGALRNLDKDDPFEFLIGVLFTPDFAVLRAASIPLDVVRKLATYVPHNNSWRLMLRDHVWAIAGVKDITAELKGAVL
jgi:hypothetical protein